MLKAALGASVRRQPRRDPLLFFFQCLDVLAALGCGADELFEPDTGGDEVGHVRKDFAILLVAEDQPVLLVEERKPLFDGLHHLRQVPLREPDRVLPSLQFRDIGSDSDRAAAYGSALRDQDPAPVCEGLLGPLARVAVIVQAVGQPLPLPANGVGELAALEADFQDLFEVPAGHQRVCEPSIDFPVFPIAQHEPILGVEQHETLGREVDGVAQKRQRGIAGWQSMLGSSHRSFRRRRRLSAARMHTASVTRMTSAASPTAVIPLRSVDARA